MKNIFVFLVFCLAVTLVYSADEGRTKSREEITKECEEEMKATNQNLSDPGCLYECMQKKVGFLNADGTLNTEKLEQEVPTLILRYAVRLVYDQCVHYGGGNSCEVSSCLERISSTWEEIHAA